MIPASRPPRRRLLGAATAALVAVLVVLPVTGAWAHSALEPQQVPAGTATDFTLTVAHGCTPGEPPPDPGEEISPTIEVAVRLPAGAQTVEPLPAPGWDATATREDGRTVVTWQGGEIPTDDIGTFGFTATLYGEEGEEVAFEVFQGCVEGEYRWIEVDEDDSGDPLEQPAPTVVLTSTSAAPPRATPDAPAPGTPTPTEAASPSPVPAGTPTAPPSAAEEEEAAPATAGPAPSPVAAGETPAAGTESSGSPVPGVLAAIVVLALAGIAVIAVAALRGRRG